VLPGPAREESRPDIRNVVRAVDTREIWPTSEDPEETNVRVHLRAGVATEAGDRQDDREADPQVLGVDLVVVAVGCPEKLGSSYPSASG
jgi:hypothetical protein